MELDLATLQQRIEDAIRRWQVLAVTGQLLEAIRASYETDRQPETLQEASGYFRQMTQGHYRRVWTPVGERILRVEASDGHGLSVEVLAVGGRGSNSFSASAWPWPRPTLPAAALHCL